MYGGFAPDGVDVITPYLRAAGRASSSQAAHAGRAQVPALQDTELGRGLL